MNTAAYDKGLPCLNPHCKSHGTPHPNCKCYGFSDGGTVGVCSGPHKPDCEYYMAGGGTASDWQDVPDGSESQGSDWEDVPQSTSSQQSQNESDWEDADRLGKYQTTEQKVKSGLEGAAEGIVGPLAPLAEIKILGVSPEDIKGRAEANPWIHGGAKAATMAAGLLTGTGEAGLIAKGAGEVAEMANLGRIGSAALKGAIEASSFAGSDELTKAILHQPGSDPDLPAGAALLNVGAAGLMGGLTGGVFGLGEKMIGKGLTSEAGTKMAQKYNDLLFRLGQSNNVLKDLGVTEKIAQSAALKGAMLTPAPMAAYPVIKAAITPTIKKISGSVNPYVVDAVVKCLSDNEVSGIPSAIHYAHNILKGTKAASNGINHLFNMGYAKIAPDVSKQIMDSLKEFIDGGQVNEQMQNTLEEQNSSGQRFANGGMVSSDASPFGNAMPYQNAVLNMAKGRISNYLNGVKPSKYQSKLAFDKPLPQNEKENSYNNAIKLAASPLSILDHVNKGDLTPEHMTHFAAMYPEVHKYLSHEMVKKITDVQVKDEKPPPYKKRQAMSLFLGTELDSTFTPVAIQTIQGMYAMNRAGPQVPQAQKPKKSTSPLSKAGPSSLTNEQARVQRQQNQKA